MKGVQLDVGRVDMTLCKNASNRDMHVCFSAFSRSAIVTVSGSIKTHSTTEWSALASQEDEAEGLLWYHAAYPISGDR